MSFKLPGPVVVVFAAILAILLIVVLPGYGGMISAGVVHQVGTSQVSNYGGNFDGMCRNGTWATATNAYLANATCESLLLNRDVNTQIQANTGLASLIVVLGIIGLVVAMIALSVRMARNKGGG